MDVERGVLGRRSPIPSAACPVVRACRYLRRSRDRQPQVAFGHRQLSPRRGIDNGIAIGGEVALVGAIGAHADNDPVRPDPQEKAGRRCLPIILPEPEVEIIRLRPLIAAEPDVPVDAEMEPTTDGCARMPGAREPARARSRRRRLAGSRYAEWSRARFASNQALSLWVRRSVRKSTVSAGNRNGAASGLPSHEGNRLPHETAPACALCGGDGDHPGTAGPPARMASLDRRRRAHRPGPRATSPGDHPSCGRNWRRTRPSTRRHGNPIIVERMIPSRSSRGCASDQNGVTFTDLGFFGLAGLNHHYSSRARCASLIRTNEHRTFRHNVTSCGPRRPNKRR